MSDFARRASEFLDRRPYGRWPVPAAAATLLAASLLAVPPGPAAAEDPPKKKPDREALVKDDRKKVEDEGYWIYGDLAAGLAKGKETGKPVLVVFRCVPCEACARLDEDVLTRDAAVRAVMDRYVCVRIPFANGMDLSLFQFDYDQSWTSFLLAPDGTILGRYGSRSHRTETKDDVTLPGFRKTLEAGLALHARLADTGEDGAALRAALAAKRGPAPEAPRPEELGTLRGKYAPYPDFAGKVVPSCIHCHMVGEAIRASHRNRGEIPERVLFPWPNPRVVGLDLDPDEVGVLRAVPADSLAAAAGFRKGDRITTFAGQPILSLADVGWVLHRADDAARVAAVVQRGQASVELSLDLPAGWRRRSDLSWRVSSWEARRMVTGGLVLVTADDAARRSAKVKNGEMALLVEFVGAWGEHAAAKKAGVRKGDVLVSFDGRKDLSTESLLLAHGLERRKKGDTVRAEFSRDGERYTVDLPVQ